MDTSKAVSRRGVLQAMMDLARGAANDAVKLAYLDPEDRDVIDRLDLGCLTEFKRDSSGTVQMKLADRAEILAELLRQLEEERRERQRQKELALERQERETQGPAAFLQALERQEEAGRDLESG